MSAGHTKAERRLASPTTWTPQASVSPSVRSQGSPPASQATGKWCKNCIPGSCATNLRAGYLVPRRFSWLCSADTVGSSLPRVTHRALRQKPGLQVPSLDQAVPAHLLCAMCQGQPGASPQEEHQPPTVALPGQGEPRPRGGQPKLPCVTLPLTLQGQHSQELLHNRRQGDACSLSRA